MSKMSLNFKLISDDTDIEKLYSYNPKAFSDAPELHWSLEGLKQKIHEGWELYAASTPKGDIVAAAMLKKEQDSLLTLSTPVKLDFQGQGFSHQIKNFFEETALKQGSSQLLSFCHVENFRLISLNETHGYEKTSQKDTSDSEVLIWIKDLSRSPQTA